jgi:hypothetical protein
MISGISADSAEQSSSPRDRLRAARRRHGSCTRYCTTPLSSPNGRILQLALIGALSSCSVYGPSLLSADNSPLQTDGAAGQDGPDGGSSGANPTQIGDAGDSGAGTVGRAGSSSVAGAKGVGGSSGAGDATGSGGSVHAGGAGRGGTSGQGGVTAQGGSTQGGAAQAGSTQGGTSGQASGGAGAVAPHDLGQGKPATASSQQTGNETSQGNDGNYATRWCASDDTVPQWWRVDLGAPHQLTSFSVTFQLATRTYGYTVETSLDDVNYDNAYKLVITGTGAVQTQDFPSGANGRYVRIRITSAPPVGTSPTWASFYEFTVQGI